MIENGNRSEKTFRIAAGILSIAAGAVHGIAAGEHWVEWWGYGTFFLLAAMGQAIYGFVLFAQPWRYDPRGHIRADVWRYERLTYRLGLYLNGAVVLLYLISRTIGVPFFGPEAGQVEPITALGVISKIFELALIGVLLIQLRRSPAQS